MKTKDRLQQFAYRFRAAHTMAGEAVNVSGRELVEYWLANDLVHRVTARSGMNGIQRIDPNEPWSVTNMRFDPEKAVKATGYVRKDKGVRKVKVLKPKPRRETRVLTIDQWLEQVRS